MRLAQLLLAAVASLGANADPIGEAPFPGEHPFQPFPKALPLRAETSRALRRDLAEPPQDVSPLFCEPSGGKGFATPRKGSRKFLEPSAREKAERKRKAQKKARKISRSRR